MFGKAGCALGVLVAVVTATTIGCSADETNGGSASTDEDELLRKTGPTAHWSYQGLLPTLESPKVIVSLKGHTVHVSGRLPQGFADRLPFHARTQEVAGRTMVHVAYPIATVDPNGRLPDGQRTRNPEPFTYDVCGGDNFHASNGIGAFGGFPFIEYVCNHRDADGRVRSGIAFHGPITSRDVSGTAFWSLTRGPVSHACNRMLGEHVLELAHVIGFDSGRRNTPVQVVADFDTFDGKLLDVDYPARGFTRPNPSQSIVFPIWQAVAQRADGSVSVEFPQWACETSRCPSMPPNSRDSFTGAPLQ
jgi:hypothetical protein